MLKAGVTGGIGSGKSVVCQVFATLGIPVFNADDAARYLMEHDPKLVSEIKDLLGDNVYENGKLDRVSVAEIIFYEPDKLQELNALVHPATLMYSRQWLEQQHSPYVIKEAAIFFESGSDKDMDVMIGVYAPQELRIERVMKRSNLSRGKVLAIIGQQMNEDEKMKLCDYVITNDDKTAILPQVLELHETLIRRSNKIR